MDLLTTCHHSQLAQGSALVAMLLRYAAELAIFHRGFRAPSALATSGELMTREWSTNVL